MSMSTVLRVLPIAAILLPGVASAQTLSKLAGVFNIFVGLMLVAAFLTFFGGLIGWYVRLGAWPSYRDDMIHVMMWAVAIMFVLVVLLALVHFVQVYQAAAAFVFGVALFLGAAWVVMTVATAKPKKEGDEH